VAENHSRWRFYVLCWKVDKLLNLRLGEETKGPQEENHRMGRVRVDKKIFGSPRW
jgi:hypothetical protein